MKKVVLAALTLALSAGVFASAQATSNVQPVTLKAISAEFISISPMSGPTVTFDFSKQGNYNNANADTPPSYTMKYNLLNRTITVCAYLSGPLTGQANASHTIDPSSINATIGGKTLTFNNTCSNYTNAITVDSIEGATQASSKTEAFQGMFIAVPGSFPPVPDTYTGTMNFVAQAQ